MSFSILITALKGSSSSGNYGHAGRLGKKGGSAPKSGIGAAMSLRTGANATQRQAVKAAITPPKSSEPYVQSDKEAAQIADYKQGLNEPTSLHGMIDGVEAWGNNTRGDVKNEIVTNISNATGLNYDAVNDTIAQWARSSNDTDYRSLSMQESAARIFGTQLSKYQKDSIANVMAISVNTDDKNHAFENASKPYNTPQAATDAFLKTMHAQTQEHFKQQGITSVTLYRGTRSTVLGAKQGDIVGVASNAMESWTIEPLVAKEFGYNVVKAEVPVSRIISTARTGFGCLNEYEYVVVGGNNKDTAIIDSYPKGY